MRFAQLCSSLAEERAGGEQSAVCCPPQYDPCVYGTSPVKSTWFRPFPNAKGC